MLIFLSAGCLAVERACTRLARSFCVGACLAHTDDAALFGGRVVCTCIKRTGNRREISENASVCPPYLLDILVYMKKISSRATMIKITHIIDPTIKREISAKGFAP
jgi:hypothetical protein